MSKYSKAIVACAAAAVEIINLLLPQTQGNVRTILGIVVVLLGAISVYAVPNSAPAAKRLPGAAGISPH
jgi:hypothetical protein